MTNTADRREVRAALPDLRDAIALAGLAMLFYGLWQVYEPAAWITVGAALFGLAVWRAG